MIENDLARHTVQVFCGVSVVNFILATACAWLDRFENDDSFTQTINFDFFRSVAAVALALVAACLLILFVPGWSEGLSPASAVMSLAAVTWVPFYLWLRLKRLVVATGVLRRVVLVRQWIK